MRRITLKLKQHQLMNWAEPKLKKHKTLKVKTTMKKGQRRKREEERIGKEQRSMLMMKIMTMMKMKVIKIKCTQNVLLLTRTQLMMRLNKLWTMENFNLYSGKWSAWADWLTKNSTRSSKSSTKDLKKFKSNISNWSNKTKPSWFQTCKKNGLNSFCLGYQCDQFSDSPSYSDSYITAISTNWSGARYARFLFL